MSIVARPPPSTSVCVTLARNAVCALLNTAINASTMSDNNVITTRTSMREKARIFTIFDLRFTIEKQRAATSPESIGNRQSAIGNESFTVR